jgi:hypothetical protein
MDITVTRSTIVKGVMPAYVGIDSCLGKHRDGSQWVIRKNPHVIDVGSGPNTLLNSWYITSMAISTTVSYAISKPCV